GATLVPGPPRGRSRADRGRPQGTGSGGTARRGKARPGTKGEVAQEHGGRGGAAARGGQHQAGGRPTHDTQDATAAERAALQGPARMPGAAGRSGPCPTGGGRTCCSCGSISRGHGSERPERWKGGT